MCSSRTRQSLGADHLLFGLLGGNVAEYGTPQSQENRFANNVFACSAVKEMQRRDFNAAGDSDVALSFICLRTKLCDFGL